MYTHTHTRVHACTCKCTYTHTNTCTHTTHMYKRTHMCIPLLHTYHVALFPTPHPTFCHLQYRQVGRAWCRHHNLTCAMLGLFVYWHTVAQKSKKSEKATSNKLTHQMLKVQLVQQRDKHWLTDFEHFDHYYIMLTKDYVPGSLCFAILQVTKKLTGH